MPLADAFLLPEQFADEHFFQLAVGFCSRCAMVQLVEQVERERMFHGEYAYYSSTSARMREHFGRLAGEVMARLEGAADPFVVEIGSNDGIMLEHFAQRGLRHLGVEPSANVAAVAAQKGARTLCRFFDDDSAAEILRDEGPADVILGANVFCHLPYLHGVMRGVARLLKPAGVLIFEDPYVGDILAKNAFDQMYDEHTFYFSASSLGALLEQHSLEIVDAAPLAVHGGSMRYTVARCGARARSAAVEQLLAGERERGLTRAETFARFQENVDQARDRLVDLLQRIRRQGKRVVGYGATAKSATVMNYCGITPDLVEFLSDTTPIKQGKFSPGMHIPVLPYQEFVRRYPDYALLFAWNHEGEILAKEQGFRDAGGQWIRYVPEVGILDLAAHA
jgi:methylation protein EvaC